MATPEQHPLSVGSRPWWKSNWFIALLLLFVAPIGAAFMWLFTRWNILVKLIATVWALFVLLLWVAGSSGGSRSASTKEPAAANPAPPTALSTSAPVQQAGQAKAAKPEAAAQPKEAPKPAAAEKPAQPLAEPGRAWFRPIPYQEPVVIKDGDKEFRITITEAARDATALMKEANMFNEDPPAGMDYLVVKAKLEYLKGPQDKPYKTTNIGNSVLANARMWGPALAVEPDPKFEGQDIFPGAVVEGWLNAFIIPGESMDTAVLSFGKGPIANTGGTWFSLGPKANTPPPLPKITASPDAVDSGKARQRDSAIPFKTPALFKGDGREIEIQVTDVIRNATREVKQANQFNEDPAPGNDYLLVKMKARYISGPEDKPWTSPEMGHSVFAQNRMWGAASVVTPVPEFGGVDLYPGGEIEGWLRVMEVPKTGMDEVILSYGKGLLGGGETWFALK